MNSSASLVIDYRNNDGWLPIITAVVVMDVAFIIFLKPLSTNMKLWYDRFGLLAVLADVVVILIGFALARYIYSFIYNPTKDLGKSKNIALFTILLVCVQVIHDIAYYFLLVKPFPNNTNAIIDYMKGYGKSMGIKAIVGDTALVVLSSILAFILANQPTHVNIFLLLAALYSIPYAIA